MGSLGRRDSRAILETAWDAGIRHFDVAPMYGYGEAEACLGEFLRQHAGQATVTTKYGIPPASTSPVKRVMRSAARSAIQRFPGLKQRVAGISAAATQRQPEPKMAFTAEQAKASLERSLRALKTDHIDLWLLHEVAANELRDASLLRLLNDLVADGTIGTFGVGSDGNKIADLVALRPEYCPILQFQWSVLDPVPSIGTAFRIHHRALTGNFRALHESLLSDPSRCRRWSAILGIDLGDRETLAKLMLKAALVSNPEGIILFSSKNAAHIRANMEAASDDALSIPAARLHELVQSDRGGLQVAVS